MTAGVGGENGRELIRAPQRNRKGKKIRGPSEKKKTKLSEETE